jgi:hypothetical protein
MYNQKSKRGRDTCKYIEHIIKEAPETELHHNERSKSWNSLIQTQKEPKKALSKEK